MDEHDKSAAARRAKVAERKAVRQNRSAAALRDNLRRRKDQARARTTEPADGVPDVPTDDGPARR